MSKILRNDTVDDVEIADTGVTVAAGLSYTIPPQDYAAFAASSDVITLLSALTLTFNDGSADVTNISDAVDILKGWFPQSSDGEPFFFDYSDVVSGDLPVTIMSIAVPGPVDSLYLSRLEVSCRIESLIQVTKNGTVIGEARTGASRPSTKIEWSPNRECLAADVIEVLLTKRAGTPDVSVGASIMGLTANPS